jgi:glutamate-1-semialdehyde 2,1-aminomutase
MSSPLIQATNPSVIANHGFSPHQQAHLSRFIAQYTQRTATSKQLAQTYRSVLADVRGSAGFRSPIKELVYPIAANRAAGSRLWDVDGNEYIDLVMGFGITLFGHNPPFIQAALQRQLQQGMPIGAQSDLAGEVADLVREFTGMERVTFSNTGTEAVMTAIRLARTATGWTKIAIFTGSYHGHADSTLAKSVDERSCSMPKYPGVPAYIAADVLVLTYGDPQSLETIAAQQQELAAVLVEPVQNSQVDLQPRDFLHQLRQLTEAAGIVLIIDEMLTGFRVHPGGVQGWFGVQADIATYGKVVGGGMPIGVIAGKAQYMDHIDGGWWDYGDDSVPQVQKTFFAGTYCKHPLAMTAAKAVLLHLKAEGKSLYEQLNQRTTQFVNTLNAYFEAESVPIRLGNFGSIFNAIAPPSPIAPEHLPLLENIDLIYYHLIHKGIYIRDGGGLLSTAHTDADLNNVIQAIQNSIHELRNGGFLPDQ